jgi:hypothetical protein
VHLAYSDGKCEEYELFFGDLKRIPLGPGEKVQAVIEPDRSLDVGAGKGKRVERELEGGIAGLILDCRGRPLPLDDCEERRIEDLSRWIKQMEVYPLETYETLLSKRNVSPSEH